ncbi:serum paraoxonase/arylesterase 1-like [Ptychodera flava]|uniref:serum paraoxonase/arylesterase 1-like n=1 Tax=Ptychodera flava TaxID=63121 RepID=UPI00396A9BD7
MLRKIIVTVVLAAVGTHVFRFLYSLGYQNTVYKHYPGPCRLLQTPAKGSEDISVTTNGLAFISSGIRLTRYNLDKSRKSHNTRGRIYLYDFNNPSQNATEIPIDGNFDVDNFYPHGLSLWGDSITGEVLLFVVNHNPKEECIEIFNFDPKRLRLKHSRTVNVKTMYNVNDLVAVGRESFYFTNDRYSKTQYGQIAEDYLLLPWGSIGFYDGVRDTLVQTGLHGPNGINISPDRRFLYVASPRIGSVTIYSISSDNSIKERKVISVYTGVDNIEIDPDNGDLWLGCHPQRYMLKSHFENVTKRSPSQVLRVKFNRKDSYDQYEIQEVFVDDGALISGSSVASVYKNKLLVGSVIHTTVYCDINAV